VGAGGANEWHQRIQVELRRAGYAGQESDEHGTRQVRTKGLRTIVSEPEGGPVGNTLPPPRCSFADLWQHAVTAGAPSGAVARITYIDKGYGFRISDTDVSIAFDHDCQPVEE
jgi:hypothetical protein